MSEFAAGERFTLYKQKYHSGELWLMWQWDEIVWHRTAEYLVSFEEPGLVFARPDAELVAERYAVFYFYPDEPFHFYELYAAKPPHVFDGWYCNINLPPQRTPDGYSYIDVDLDLWVYPDLTYAVLDEDEYSEHSAKYHYPAALKQTAEQTVDVIRELVARETFPFRRNVQTMSEELAALAARYHIAPLSRSSALTTVKP